MSDHTDPGPDDPLWYKERGRLYGKILELWDEDNAHYPVDDDGITPYPVGKLKAFTESLLLIAATTVLQMYDQRRMDKAEIAARASHMAKEALSTMADIVIKETHDTTDS